jgi:hypothetical protein
MKLESVASEIGKLGTFVAIVTFLVLSIRYFIKISLEDGEVMDKIGTMETL